MLEHALARGQVGTPRDVSADLLDQHPVKDVGPAMHLVLRAQLGGQLGHRVRRILDIGLDDEESRAIPQGLREAPSPYPRVLKL